MTTVKISETYDLSTQVDKIGLIGIHTPSMQSIKTHWSGLCQNHRFVKVESCDVMVACASMLPADPSQIGTEAGKIAPQDMMNPMLYKAVSNDSFGNIQNRIYFGNQPFVGKEADASFEFSANEGFIENDADHDVDAFKVYYGLLSDTERFRKAMPQNGLEMTGLYPIVHQVVSTYGSAVMNEEVGDKNEVYDPISGFAKMKMQTFRGESLRMPAIPIHKAEYEDNEIPTTYVGMIVMPPAKLHKLYYRLKVVWTVTFSGLCSVTEYQGLDGLTNLGKKTYATDYAQQSRMMSHITNMVDVKDAEITKIMEGTK